MRWEYATTEQDARDLANFVCTEAAPASLSPDGDVLELEDEWEYEVQVELQAADVPPPLGEYVLIGRDSGPGIAAACWWGETNGPRYVRLFSIAVALRLRRTGLYVGDELMDEVKMRLVKNAQGQGEYVMAEARVDHSNANSQDLMVRHNFYYSQNDGWYQRWWLRLDLD